MEHTPRTRVHAFSDDALGDLDAVGLAEEIRARRVSPLEAVEAAIARTEQVDPVLHGVAVSDFDRARKRAANLELDTGFFAGVPTFVKDNADVAGLPTQHGTRAFTGSPKAVDGDMASAYFKLGVVNLGKSQLPEYGVSASAETPGFEPVRNPWHTAYSSGASSAGAAVLVASGAVPMAHANDGGGSIRIPASVCGLVGLKPTRGRVPQDKMNREMPVRVVADGVVVRSVRDAAAHLREIEKVSRALKLPPVGDVTAPGRKRLRVGMIVDSPFRKTDAETGAVVRRTGELLESLGHHVEEIDAPVPVYFEKDFRDYYGFLFLFLNATGRRSLDPSFDWRRTDNLTRGMAGDSLRHLWRMPLAGARLWASQYASKRLYRDYDLTLTPTLGTVTPKIGHLDPTQPYEVVMERLLDWVSFTPLQNATGAPAMSVPAGMSSAGTPIGVQLGATHGAEARLLGVGYELEAAAPFARIQA